MSICVPFVFVTLGVAIKFGDQAFDEDLYDRNLALLLAVPAGLAMGVLMMVDVNTLMIFTGLLLALFLSSKIDNVAFKIGAILAGALAGLSLLSGVMLLEMLVIALVALAGYMDEVTSDRADHAGSWAPLLAQRPFLKALVLLLCITGALSSYLYLFAFLGFDFGYSYMEGLSNRRSVNACTT